ncbi:MAG: peptidylprolyl isomerase [Thermomicrobiales bacterium]
MNSFVEIVTEAGTIEVELYPEAAPGTVANFLELVDSGAYDGGAFYRTVTLDNQPDDEIRIAVIQGGVSKTFDGDAHPELRLERTSVTGLHHLDGTISMARRTPDSARTEFFICVGDQPELDFGGRRNPDGQGFAAFGQVTGGMDVVRAINASPRDGQSLTPVVTIDAIRRVAR